MDFEEAVKIINNASPYGYFKRRPDVKQSIDDYIEKGWKPGDFLTSVLANDLFEAMGRADLENRENLYSITCYIYNESPSTCWGSYEIVYKWLEGFQKEIK